MGYNTSQETEPEMGEWTQIGKLLLLVGIGLALVGGVLVVGARLFADKQLPWLGRLPGDIRIEHKGFSCFFPLATSIILSLLLTLILNIVVRLMRR
jgi:H+/Cl- antiporter ClcA